MTENLADQFYKGLPIITLRDAGHWRQWLDENHAASAGVWLRLFRKSSEKKNLTHDEALLDALCFGWIDGQSKSFDEESFLQKFTPRRKRSLWSKRNTELVLQLIAAGKMQAAGLKEIEEAKADGRWDKAYDSHANMTIPDDFLKKLAEDEHAMKFFKSLNKTNLYAITWRLQTAKKEETRLRRMEKIIAMLAKGEKFH